MADLYTEARYAPLLAGTLSRFRKGGSNVWTFRCPYCGDSKKNLTKTRGYIHPDKKKNRLSFKCHNCGESKPFDKFLSEQSPSLHSEMVLESMRSRREPRAEVVLPHFPRIDVQKVIRKVIGEGPLAGLKSISQLPADHPAVLYVRTRMIPSFHFQDILFAPKFFKLARKLNPERFPNEAKSDEPRILIQFRDREQNLIGLQGRKIEDTEGPKYVNIILGDGLFVWGGDRLNTELGVIALEGPIDAMFLPNAIGLAGAKVTDLSDLGVPPEKIEMVFDNEPRNREIVKMMQQAAERGYPVCIWPPSSVGKDVNDMVKALVAKDHPYPNAVSRVLTTIRTNKFSGVVALAMIEKWRRCE